MARNKRFPSYDPSLEDVGMLMGMGKRMMYPFVNNNLEDAGMVMGLGKRSFSGFAPSLEDQGMVLGLGKRFDALRGNPEDPDMTAGWSNDNLAKDEHHRKHKKFNKYHSFGPSVSDDGMLLAMG